MRFCIQEDSIRLQKTKYSCQIFGKIWIEIDERLCFPEEEWDDFIIVIAGWWLKEILKLQHVGDRAKFLFMDGAFSFDVTLSGNAGQQCDIGFYASGTCIATISTGLAEFARNLRSMASSIIRAVESRHLECSDVPIMVDHFAVFEQTYWPRVRRLRRPPHQ